MATFEQIDNSLDSKEKEKRKMVSQTQEFYRQTGIPSTQRDQYHYQGYDMREEERITNLIERMDTDESTLTQQEKKLAQLRRENLHSYFKDKHRYDRNEAFITASLRQEESREQYNKDSNAFIRNEEIDRLDSLLRDQQTLHEGLAEKTPESFYAQHIMELKDYKEQLDEGKLVEVPYVRERLDTIKGSMRRTKPVFIHGHLGSGKSVSAYEAAREFMIDFHVEKDFEEWMQTQINQMKENGSRTIERFNQETKEFESAQTSEKPSKDEIGKKLLALKKFYETDDADETQKKLSFYAIAGSKETSVSDLYTTKTLGLEKVNGKTMQEHVQTLSQERKEWRHDHEGQLSKLDDEKKEAEITQANEDISRAYEMKYAGFGTVVEDIKMELRRAIEEGKPFVFDELNAVPAEVLLAMNDLLTKKVGDEAFIPGVGQVTIADGFAPIFTGNMNLSGLAHYHGVQELNPAFLSRLNPMEFDYPPQRVDGNFNTTSSEGDNELFKILVAKTLDKNGNANVPNGSFEKIYNLSIFASKAQKIFSGKWKESHVGEIGGIEPQLEKTVLSVRALSNIMEEWNGGREMDMDMAIWKSFIETASNPTDKRILYEVAQGCGFFEEKEGWNPISAIGDVSESSSLSEGNVRSDKYEHSPQERNFMSAKEVVQMVYGDAPERIVVENEEQVNFEQLQDLGAFFGALGIEKYSRAMDQAGCAV